MKNVNEIFDAICAGISRNERIGPLMRSEILRLAPSLESGDNRILRLEKDGALVEVSDFPGLAVNFTGSGALVIVSCDACLKGVSMTLGNRALIAMDKITVKSGLRISAHGGDSPVCFIGRDTTIGRAVMNLNTEHGKEIFVGRDCMLSVDILMRTSDGHPVYDAGGRIVNRTRFGAHIGNHVWLGQSVTVLKDTAVADGCICGYGALLNKAYPESGCLLAGVPARLVRRNVSWSRKDPEFTHPATGEEESRKAADEGDMSDRKGGESMRGEDRPAGERFPEATAVVREARKDARRPSCTSADFVRRPDFRIATFGSCLSRFTAEQYIRLLGGRIESAVYNNRSDFFVRDFLDGDDRQLAAIKMLAESPDLSLKERIILRRQTREEIGILINQSGDDVSLKHKRFLDDEISPDLILMDNYIDLVGKSVSADRYPEIRPFFCIASAEAGLSPGSYISVEESLNCHGRIIRYLRDRFPEAKLVFLSFPDEGYRKEHEIHGRKERFDSGLERLDADLRLKLHLNSAYYLTNVSQHFKPQYYAAVASAVYSLLNADRIGRIVPDPGVRSLRD